MTDTPIPYGRQLVDDDDVAAVVAVLRSDRLTQGPAVAGFERDLAEACEAAHAVAFSSGTAALHAAAAAAGLGAGDVVATSPLTFAASANAARYVGAVPNLVDIDPDTWNLDVAAVPDDVDGLVAVHYAGLPMQLSQLASRPRVVIEDAAHALGARTVDGPVGRPVASDLVCVSLHPVKPITAGEGGAVTTDDDGLADALRRFRDHGIVRRPDVAPWYYEVGTVGAGHVGHNLRMTDLQAALARSQLTKLDRFVARRGELAERYRVLLAELPVGLPPAAPAGAVHGHHLFAVRVAERRRVVDELHAAGIGVQVHYVPLHHHPVNADLGLVPGDLPVCDALYQQLVSLPLFPALTEAEQDRVVATLARILEGTPEPAPLPVPIAAGGRR